ncbi:MAG: aldehyde dehydrogenase family protein, partial [Gammaproteobacteria bacterium]|nr:aldehyde dehydrogenase family protein [Gammaproteobacteria bacterium]
MAQHASSLANNMTEQTIVSTAPGDNYQVLGEVAISSEQQIVDSVAAAKQAQPSWQALSLDERCQWLKKLRTAFADRAADIAQSIADEVGKTRPAADSELETALNKFDWFIDNVEQAIQPQTTFEDENTLHQIHYEPYGVAAVIAPWNYPASMFAWGVAPNLLVGNTVVFKHSEECPL